MDKQTIYDYILKNKNKFLSIPNFSNIDDRLKYWLIKNNLLQYIEIDNITIKNTYDFLIDDKDRYCGICNKENKFIRFGGVRGSYRKFCSKKCKHIYRSNRLKADNPIHNMSTIDLLKMRKKVSDTLKEKIKNGTFTPQVINSWAKSRCDIIINRNGKQIKLKMRSSWDAYFQIAFPNLIYEKIRVPYCYNGTFHSYIIDFLDSSNKIIYEIKPESQKDTKRNILKKNAAIKWANDNDFIFKYISDDWFFENYRESLLLNQPDEIRLKRLLKQFVKK